MRRSQVKDTGRTYPALTVHGAVAADTQPSIRL